MRGVEYTKDGTVDLKGNPVLRSNTGRWRATSFIVGTKPNISTMGADQFDEFEPTEKTQKISFFKWWVFSIFFGTLFASTFLVYIQDHAGWGLGYGLPTIGLFLSILVFLAGSRYYRHQPASGSPLTKMARVLIATIRKWNVVVPDDSKELHELNLDVLLNIWED
ncbi:hypothetical protein DCAR_0728879 [Daucus carota subsp. sativus]|uniref:Uncharacterized protein n=1 Tax=Daucus carota subsp. sativus TaxID=79200 RepID=A0AAF0XLV5_DAUCS|nr:hypothetical protein DCAR_0728879 [Daucus carota subsp. sativus]